MWSTLVISFVWIASWVQRSEAFVIPNDRSIMRTLRTALSGDDRADSVVTEVQEEKKTPIRFEDGLIDELELELEEARLKAFDSEQRAASLEAKVKEYEVLLDKKERMLEGGRHKWVVEKERFFDAIARLSARILETEGSARENSRARQEELEDEISGLKSELRKVQEDLEMEIEASEETKQNMLNIEDALEFEQMKLVKERKSLDDRVRNERERLSGVEKKFKEEQEYYEQERSKLMSKLESKNLKLKRTEAELNRLLQNFEEQQGQLKKEFKQLEADVQKSENDIEERTERFSKERRQLKSQLSEEKSRLKDTEKLIGRQEDRMNKATNDLDIRLIFEKVRLKQMADKINEEEASFRAERDVLQGRIEEESCKLSELEEDLSKEMRKFYKKRKAFGNKVADVDRVTQLKARQMNNRCEQIRRDMNKLIDGTKRQAVKEQRSLIKKYQTKVDVVDDTILELEQALATAKQGTVGLERQLKTVTMQRDAVVQENRVKEQRFIHGVASRNKEIMILKSNAQMLKEEIAYQEDKIEQYESSYKQLAVLSLKLARERLIKSGKWVKRVIPLRRGKSNKDSNSNLEP